LALDSLSKGNYLDRGGGEGTLQLSGEVRENVQEITKRFRVRFPA
jgi:hypothetical protein